MLKAVPDVQALQLFDELQSELRRLRDLLIGASATKSIDAMRNGVREAGAIADTLVQSVESYVAVEHERQRSQRVARVAR